MGTPDFALTALQGLVTAGHDIAAVYAQPPRRAGRGKSLRPTPVHAWADAQGLPVRTPASLRDEAAQLAFAGLTADIAVVAAYGLILPPAILDAPTRGCLNIHASLLPRWRGAAPIQRAIQAGDDETGVTIMRMDEGLDTGDMLLRESVPITPDTTGGALHDTLADLGARLIVDALARLDALTPTPQPSDGATYAAKIDKREARIDWSRPAALIERTVRAFNPFPGAWFEVGGQRIRILEAAVTDGSGRPGTVVDDVLTIACSGRALRPTVVQRQGRAPVQALDLLRGFPIPAGTLLDGPAPPEAAKA